MCSGCAWVTVAEHDQARDRDGDGVVWPTDCDDQDPTIGAPTSWFYDGDLDGYGAGTPVASCVAPPQHSDRDDDCDDGNAEVHPDAVERCNGADDDCNGADDDGDVDQIWYPDEDGDGWGDESGATATCDPAPSAVDQSGDCDDQDAAISPGAQEICGGGDEDCDGDVDEDDALDATAWHPDEDGDGLGDHDVTVQSCVSPEGWVSDGSDCDDEDASIGSLTWYVDDDGDGYGTPGDGVESCEPIDGRADNDLDCHDDDDQRTPGQTWSVPGDYDTLADAVDDACSLDTLKLARGSHEAGLDLEDKELVIIGVSGSSETTLTTSGDRVLTMEAGSLTGLTLRGGSSSTSGGCLSVHTSTSVSLADVELMDCATEAHGGALSMSGTGAVDVHELSVTDSEAALDGGAIAIELGDGLAVTLDTVTISDSAGRNGGALAAWGSVGQLDLSALTSTTTTASDTGGALWLSDGVSVLAADLTVRDAVAASAGGAWLDAEGTVDTAVLVDTIATDTYGGLFASGALTLSSLTLEDHHAPRWGGGWLLADVVDGLTASRVSSAEAPVWALEEAGGSPLIATEIDLRGHEAQDGGATLSLTGSIDAAAVIVAGASGIGVRVAPDPTGSGVTLSHATVVGGTGHGLSVEDSGAGVALSHIAVVGNGGAGISSTDDAPTISWSAFWANEAGHVSGMSDPIGVDDNVEVAPGFFTWGSGLPSSSWALGLRSDSALRDAGDPSSTDADGSQADIGGLGGPSATGGWYEDDDGDGLPDGWEERFSQLGYTASDDPDGDGLDQADELEAGSRPDRSDSDLDGKPDSDETAAASDPAEHERPPSGLVSSATTSSFGQAVASAGTTWAAGADGVWLGEAPGDADTLDQALAVVQDSTGGRGLGTALDLADIDGDGAFDLILGMPDASDGGAGAGGGAVFLGPLSGTLDLDEATLSWSGETAGAALGTGIQATGSGEEAQLLLAAPGSDEVHVLADPATAPLSAAVRVQGTSGEALGSASCWLGDVDGDGISDVAMGAPEAEGGGAAYVFMGPLSSNLTTADADSWVLPETLGSQLGSALVGGDLDGDGLADLVVGLPGASARAGEVAGWLGPLSATTTPEDSAWRSRGEASGWRLGAALAMGDLDGDGRSEVAVGAPGWRSGAVFVFSGPASGSLVATEGSSAWLGDGTGALGSALVHADLDDDGTHELLAGAPGSTAGALWWLGSDDTP